MFSTINRVNIMWYITMDSTKMIGVAVPSRSHLFEGPKFSLLIWFVVCDDSTLAFTKFSGPFPGAFYLYKKDLHLDRATHVGKGGSGRNAEKLSTKMQKIKWSCKKISSYKMK